MFLKFQKIVQWIPYINFITVVISIGIWIRCRFPTKMFITEVLKMAFFMSVALIMCRGIDNVFKNDIVSEILFYLLQPTYFFIISHFTIRMQERNIKQK